jgi:hypothetical protein
MFHWIAVLWDFTGGRHKFDGLVVFGAAVLGIAMAVFFVLAGTEVG